MIRMIFRFRRRDAETWAGYSTKTARSEVVAECMWRSVGWACDNRPNAVLEPLNPRLFLEKYMSVEEHKKALNML